MGFRLSYGADNICRGVEGWSGGVEWRVGVGAGGLRGGGGGGGGVRLNYSSIRHAAQREVIHSRKEESTQKIMSTTQRTKRSSFTRGNGT